MGWRFRNTIRLLPGVRLNISKGGISTSIGPRGASLTFGKEGTRANVGLPGTGVSHSQMLSSSGSEADFVSPAKKQQGCLIISAVLGFILIITTCSLPNGETAPAAQISSENADSEENEAYVLASSLNARAGPSVTAPVLLALKRGEKIRIAERKSGWVKVIRGATTFWLAAKHISSTPPREDLKPSQVARIVSPSDDPRKSSMRSSDESCPCSSGRVCTGPRGGRYCHTSGANKRYGI